ncbi:hypothetical protein [Metaclostridioides mangenotii]|uniref:hypothetical protein n=1 Tax=Metaclostridioides mangenotii TaxID=1540 RepID=UPI000480C0E4|nr:hypothetical protein [Clostridioides mangenotii]
MNLKYFKRKIAILLAAALVIIPISETTYALERNKEASISSEEKTTESKDVEELVKKYDLEVCDIPEGVTPIVVNSEEELQQVINNIDNLSEEIETQVPNRMARAASKSKSVTFSKSIGMGAKFNAYGTVNYSNGKITSVTGKGQSLTGYTLGLSLTKGSTTSTRTTKKATITARGTINGHILVNGIGTVYSKDHTVSGTYTLK